MPALRPVSTALASCRCRLALRCQEGSARRGIFDVSYDADVWGFKARGCTVCHSYYLKPNPLYIYIYICIYIFFIHTTRQHNVHSGRSACILNSTPHSALLVRSSRAATSLPAPRCSLTRETLRHSVDMRQHRAKVGDLSGRGIAAKHICKTKSTSTA